MANLSDSILDRMLRDTINVIRLAEGQNPRVVKVLKRLERELLADLEDVVGKTPFTVARMKELLKQTQAHIAAAYGDIAIYHGQALGDVAAISVVGAVKAINAAVGAALTSTQWTPEQLAALASKAMINGGPAKDWWAQQTENLRRKFLTEMRLGQLRGETVGQLVQRVRGTRAMNYADGIMRAPTRQAEALVRTAALGVSNAARMEVYAENDSVIKGVQWHATLDPRTCLICAALDGKAWNYPKGDGGANFAKYVAQGHDKKFVPAPIHFNCRCVVIPVTKSWEELAGAHGNTVEARKADRVPAGLRAAMNGQVASDITFDEWLKGKDEAFQNEILGPRRAAAWRRGTVQLSGLTDQRNNPLNLRQLGIGPVRKPAIGPRMFGAPPAPPPIPRVVVRIPRPPPVAPPPFVRPPGLRPAVPPSLTIRAAQKIAQGMFGVPPPAPPVAAARPTMTPSKPPASATREKTTMSGWTVESMKRNHESGGVEESHVVKFTNGKRGMWKPGGMWANEVAASDIADMIGLDDLVPPTIKSTIGGKVGSIMSFVEKAKPAGKLHDSLKSFDGDRDAARAAAFDYFIGNQDRHHFNWMLSNYEDSFSRNEAKIHLIDHGRTVGYNRYGMRSNLVRWAQGKDTILGVTRGTPLTIPREVHDWLAKWPEIEEYLKRFDGGPAYSVMHKLNVDRMYKRLLELTQATRFEDLKE